METILLVAQSLDGRITRGAEPGDGFTSEADKIHFKNAVRSCDCWIQGGTSYRLSRERLARPLSPGLRRVVWTRRPEAGADEAVPGLLEFTDEAPATLTARLRTEGQRRCALLGGSAMYGAWLRAGLVDRLWVTVEPRIFGAGLTLADAAPESAWRLREVRRLPDSDSVLLDYEAAR